MATPQGPSEPRVARRTLECPPSPISQLSDLLNIPGAVPMAQGIVHWSPPAAALHEIASVLSSESPVHKYGPVLGENELRAALQKRLFEQRGVSREVILTPGANEGFIAAMLVCCEAGDEVIVFSPYYFNAMMAMKLLGIRPVVIPSHPDLSPDLSRIPAAVTPRTRAVAIVNPCNPTGYVWTQAEINQLEELCVAAGLWLISDETYEAFVFEGAQHISPKSKNTISLHSFSKSYGMAGWRMGYLTVPPHVVLEFDKVQDTAIINVARPSQLLALRCLSEEHQPYFRQLVASLDACRDLVWTAVSQMPGTIRTKGAIYFWVRLPSAGKPPLGDDHAVVRYLAEKFLVKLLPGSAFGAPNYLRVSFSSLPPEELREAVERLRSGLAALRLLAESS